MPTAHEVGPLTQIPEGGARMFRAGRKMIAVFRTAEGVFASQAECPHRQGPLANGFVAGTTLTCSFHQWTFDLRTGETENGDCGIAVYPVAVDANGMVTVTVP